MVKQGRYGLYLYNENDAYVGRSIHEYGEYGQHEADLFVSLGGQGKIAVEVGANIGSLTMPIGRSFSKVYAFEPQMGVFKMLCANMALNHLDHVDCFNMGVGDENTEITLPSIDYSRPGNYGAFEMEKYAGQGEIRTRVVRLDDFLDLPALDLLKIDVEGMEEQVLRGARALIDKHAPTIFLENDRPEKSESLIEYLWELGYNCYWQITPLYNRDNFTGKTENVFDVGCSFNMLCSRDELPLSLITNSGDHPLSRSMNPKTENGTSTSEMKAWNG